MAFSYDFTTNPSVAYVRLLIADTDASCFIFSDAEIIAAYTVQAGGWQSAQRYSGSDGVFLPSTPISYRRVAALLLDSLAANRSRLGSIAQLLDVKLHPGNMSKDLRDQAKALRDEDDDGSFAVIEQVNNDWSWRDRWWKQAQRQGI